MDLTVDHNRPYNWLEIKIGAGDTVITETIHSKEEALSLLSDLQSAQDSIISFISE